MISVQVVSSYIRARVHLLVRFQGQLSAVIDEEHEVMRCLLGDDAVDLELVAPVS